MSDTVLVTGATRGLGLAIAKQLAADGYKVIITARTLPNDTRDWLEATPGVHFEPQDLADLDGLHDFAQRIGERHGRLYGLVNNAAIGVDGVLATQHESDIARILSINLHAPILLSKYLLRPMLINQRGRIVNVSSIIADTGFKGLSVYAASKAGLHGFSKSLAREVGSANITVNAVAPGYMETDMTAGMSDDNLARIRRRSPLNRLARVEDVAATVALLLGEAGHSISGTVMTVDAGGTA